MIVIPMAGKSSRFFEAGFLHPKYELVVGDFTVFYHAINSFRKYFESDLFLFIIRNEPGVEQFIRSEITKLGVKKFNIKKLEGYTQGQADTVFQGLQSISLLEPLYIFNIDTFRPGFLKPKISHLCDGYLEVFEGDGEHWSFVEPGPDGQVIRTTEKKRISNLCCDGLYYFRDGVSFMNAFNYAFENNITDRGEYYVAPLYNHLIQHGLDIRYVLINPEEVIFCGTPDEFLALNCMNGSKEI
jgi:hypothetical protein